MNTNKIDTSSIELDGIDTKDYPDFVDAFITSASFLDGAELNDAELEKLNEDGSFVYDQVMNYLF